MTHEAPARPPEPARAVGPEPDWPEAAATCRGLLADLIAVDTSNPPGNEAAAATVIARALAGAGIEAETFESAPGRANLVARLRGSGARPPLLLLGHLDVVGVERAQWASDPFALVERDGFLYGRGVIDDKGMVATEVVTLLLLARLRVPLERDVVLLAAADEEAGGTQGIRWMLDHRREVIDAEYAINEGGRVRIDASGAVRYVAVQTAEKRGVNVTLTATGVAGHASMPRADNCVVALARAIERVAERFPMQLTPETRAFFAAMAALETGPLREAMERLADPERAEAAAEIVGRDLMHDAMLRHTVSPTIVQGGFRANVIPATAEATLNCRLLPGADLDAFRRELERRIADPAVRVAHAPPKRPEAPSVPFAGPVVEAVRRSVARGMPGAAVVPLLSTGATDSAQLRAEGIQAYGLLPFPLTPGDEGRMHGKDERMPVASLAAGLRLLYEVTAEVAGRG